MNTLIRSALIALVLSSASVSMAASADTQYSDNAKPYGSYNLNSPEGNRAFWDAQTRGGN